MIDVLSRAEFIDMVVRYHYSKVLPKLTKHYLGDRELKAVMSLGWGVRPLHTIRKIFPTLLPKDYYEIGKMCIADEMKKNTATMFISRVVKYLKKNHHELKVLFTWADGMLGKPGYVYQAANFLYGGFIWTDSYFSENGEKIHPRATGAIGGRPTVAWQEEHGWSHYRGKQFRYIYFLTKKKEARELLETSPFKWGVGGPKSTDLAWKKRVNGKWVYSSPPPYDKNAQGFSKGLKQSLKITRQRILFAVDG